MCGIFFACSDQEHVGPDDATKLALEARGPDSFRIHHAYVSSTCDSAGDSTANSGYYLTFASSVLSLRGDRMCVQPLVDSSTGSVLCWNGEAWKVDGLQVCGNDTGQIFSLLLDASASIVSNQDGMVSRPSKIVEALTRVTGPYAFVYFDAPASVVYYGRDKLGRRSLVLNSTHSVTTISSLSLCSGPAVEVTTDGIHYLDLATPKSVPQGFRWSTTSPLLNTASPSSSEVIISVPSAEAVLTLRDSLSKSLQFRVLDVPTYTVTTSFNNNPSRVAVLFSGGLDCSLLARIAHDMIPLDQPIDLLNVAFENPRTVRAAAQSAKQSKDATLSTSPYETCPDRVTARNSFAELLTICPSRTWRFVAIDIPYTETLAHRPTVIRLMSPHNTEMDLSITLALYFASRGQGTVITDSNAIPTPYATTARVLLSGLGADELFGGYARHAAAFNRDGWTGLTSELLLDFNRIGTRNLGRDDRVMSHWGREIRYPYLDEDFVRFALRLPAWEKVGFRSNSDRPIPKHFEGSSGEQRVMVERPENLDPAKMILRLAAWELGIKGVAAEKKRAIQFGARTAKMEVGRTKGTDVLDVK